MGDVQGGDAKASRLEVIGSQFQGGTVTQPAWALPPGTHSLGTRLSSDNGDITNVGGCHVCTSITRASLP